MRLFVALDIDDSIRQRLARFLDGVHGFAPDARWVRPESLHVTLKFIGEKPGEMLEPIKSGLAKIQGETVDLAFRGYGFFPAPKSARVFWIGMEAGAQLATLAANVDRALSVLGIPQEDRPYSPHLTLARGGGGSGAPGRQKTDRPNRVFQRLQEKLELLPPPEFGAMTAREFFLYQSQLGSGGSRYTKLAPFPLTGEHQGSHR